MSPYRKPAQRTAPNDDLEFVRFRERVRSWSLRDFVRRERLAVVVLGGFAIPVLVYVFLCMVAFLIGPDIGAGGSSSAHPYLPGR
jgi:hypothetical protein